MNCECNNNSNRVEPRIKHVYGNVLRMAIPLTLRTLVKDGDEMIVNDTDFIPSSDHLVRVVFSKGKTNYPITATMDGNVAIIEDKGKIPVGTYDISVECYDDLGNPYRFKQNAVLYVADTTAEAGIDEEIEYEAQTWYLNAAVFLATTEIGEIGDVIDAKLDDVFGNVLYDANAKEIRFYNKGNSRVLATIDSRPFIVDGTVADVYIDVSRQVLVVVLNEDAGGRRFSVPLYLVFNSYYKKDEVDSLVSRTVEGVRFDFSQELPLVVPVTKNGSSISSPIDYGAIENAIREDGRLVVACVNNGKFYQLLNANGMEVVFSRVVALDGYQELLIVNKSNVWSMENVDLGTGGGGGGYEPPIGGIPKTDLASDVQTSLGKADTALQQSDLSGYATQDDVDDAINGLVNGAPAALDTLKELADALGDNDDAVAALTNQLANKVDKEFGKGLSSNDFTTALRNKLMGIEAGAQVNVKADWNAESGDAQILNKPTIPTKTSDLTNDSGYLTQHQDISGKADKSDTYTKTQVDDKVANAGKVKTVSVNGGTPSQPDAQGNVDVSVAAGKSAYQVAVDNGYIGSEAEWLVSLKGNDGVASADEVVVVHNLDGEPSSLEQGQVAVLGADVGQVVKDKIEDLEPKTTSNEADFDIRDENGNVLFEISNGHIKTKEFDSSNIHIEDEESDEDDVYAGGTSADTDIRDEDGNVIVSFSDGHIKTAEFDSRNVRTSENTYDKQQTNQLLSSVGGGREKRHLNILVLGNSYSHDSFMYVPFMLKEYGIDITIGIYERGAGSVYHAKAEYNKETAGDFAIIDTSVDASWRVIFNQTSPHKCVAYPQENELSWRWDMIVFQQASMDSVKSDQYDPSTNVYRYVDELLELVMADAEYPFMLGWNINHTNNINDGEYNYPFKVLERCKATSEHYPVDIVFPYGTAIFIAQEDPVLSLLGSGGDLRYSDNVHLNEGLPCYLASLAIIECLFRNFYPMFTVIGDTTVPDSNWRAGKGLLGQHGTPVGLTDENRRKAQCIAVQANLNKFNYKTYKTWANQ